MQINTQNNDLLLGKIQNSNDAKNFVNNSLKNAGIDILGKDLSVINSDHLMSAYVLSSLGFNDNDQKLHENGAVVSTLNLNANKYLDIINGSDNINPARPEDEIDKISKKIADFVIKNADGDLDKLYKGKAGVIEGFRQATQMQNSNKNLDKILNNALELINKEITDLGGNIFDIKA